MSSSVLAANLRRFSQARNSNLINLLQSMPKEMKHIAEAQRQRKRIKEKSSKYSPGRVTLQVLGTGAKGAPRCLYVFSDQSRYLFNCGEGTQRLAHEHKMKLAKLEHVFVTTPTWDNIGGLPGAALTMQDVGVPHITLHGPPGLEGLFMATRRFVVIKDLEITVADCTEDTTFEDNVMKVKYVPITTCGATPPSEIDSPILEDDIDYYAHEQSGTRKTPPQLSESVRLLLEASKYKKVSMAYVCRLQPRPGALCLEKCVRHGVPPGPILGRLKAGEDVTLANGKVVKASDVCEPDDPGPLFIVVDCPSEDYLDSLLENETFKKHQVTATLDEDIAYTVVHFTPTVILNHPKYKEWVDRFTPSTHHIVLNSSNTCMGSAAVHRIQHKLNLLSGEIFPLMGDCGTESLEEASLSAPQSKKMKSNDDNAVPPIEKLTFESPVPPETPYIFTNTLYNHHLRPKKGSDRSAELKLVPAQFVDETMAIASFPQLLEQVRQQVVEKQKQLTIGEYPKLLFLGTGSSIPNKTRNTSGMLLEIDAETIIVIDCGEGTYGQIVRFYGTAKVDEVLRKIKAVYISHLHADHHLGLIGLLQGRRQAFKTPEPLLLFAPKQIMAWLTFYDRYFESISSSYKIISNTDLLFKKNNLSDSEKSEAFNRLKMADISTCYVRHCPNAFGVAFTHQNGFKVTYSGDTMPCDALVELGNGSDLLIHEATMEDELETEAVIKMHSTTSQAIEIGTRMAAKYTLLTHFSQRYAKLPRFNDNFSENVGIAFDNMMVRLDELPLLSLLYPALKVMFVEHYEELEHKAAKRQLRLEREKDAPKATN